MLVGIIFIRFCRGRGELQKLSYVICQITRIPHNVGEVIPAKEIGVLLGRRGWILGDPK